LPEVVAGGRLDPPARALDGRVAIVTGAARGMGRAIADVLGRRGARVLLVDILAERLAETAEQLGQAGLEVLALAGNVADPATAGTAVQRCRSAWGRLDILVNNAAIGGRHAPVWDLSDEEWRQMMAVNLDGPFYFCRAAVPLMLESGWGRIVNVASTAAKSPPPGTGHYSSSKAGLVALTKALGRELAEKGILVNAVTPGGFDTEIRNRPGVDRSLLESSLERVPMHRLGQPHEVALLVGFLASPDLTFSTGAVFDISGGYSSY
jgi:NAD(P)-dependent dehydrogenase (short-subunit alcohol dehydrogenase family)